MPAPLNSGWNLKYGDVFRDPYFDYFYPSKFVDREPEPEPEMTTKNEAKNIIENEAFVRAWVYGRDTQFRYDAHSDWQDITPLSARLDLALGKSNYRVKPINLGRWAVYNFSPEQPGNKPYFLVDFPNQADAGAYINRHNDQKRDLRIVHLCSTVLL